MKIKGWSRGLRMVAAASRRRGSVMVMILGALAMLAVIVVAYHAIGRSDSQRSAAVTGAHRVEEQVARVSDYFAEVLARDVFATYTEGLDPATNLPILMRETWDYPSTDFRARSVSNNAPSFNPFIRFDPAGTYDTRSPTGGVDLRIPSDPFLASTEPVWLDPQPGATPEDIRDNSLDWLHITNAAPDGRFVNLFNLRNNFDSRSGFGAGEMSSNLTLYDANGLPYAANGNQTLPWGASADLNVPAHWTMYQRRSLRPLNDPGRSWAAPEFRRYQWADADGDGLADSRWFELVDASDPRNIRSLLPDDGRFRYFVAARIVDLSGLVNVNTATDFTFPPYDGQSRTLVPPGLHPSEVDLRRLLTMSDTIEGLDQAYEFLTQPMANNAENYSGYDPTAARDVGNAAYNGLRRAITDGGVPPPLPGLTGFWRFTSDGRAMYYRTFAGFGPEASQSRVGSPMGLEDELELRARRGINNPDVHSRLESSVEGRDASRVRYGPLRSPRSLAVEMGRDDDDGPQFLGNGFADPEALTRLAVDVRSRLTTISGARPLTPRRIVYPSAGDLRSYANLLNPTRELRRNVLKMIQDAADDDSNTAGLPDADPLFQFYIDALAPFLGEANAWTDERMFTLAYGYERFPDYSSDPPKELKSPELAVRMAATATANQIDLFDFDRASGTPGSISLTQKKSLERHEPTAMTLLLDPNYRAQVASDTLRYPWWTAQGRRLDVGDARLDATRASNLPRAINVFGVEAQPFLTEVVVFTMHTDAPASTGKADEFTGDPTGNEPFVTIDGTVNSGNPDFMLQVIGFQITNPFDAEIALTSDTAAANPIVSLYYVEFGGRFYRLQSQDMVSGGRSGVTLKPRESRVFFAMSQDPAEVVTRWNAVRTGGSPLYTIDDVRQWIGRQLTVSLMSSDPPVTSEPVWIRQFDPLTGVDARKDPTGEPVDGVYTFLHTDAAQNRTVRLWRRMLPTGETETSNRLENDLLADRMRDPTAVGSPPILERKMPNGDNDISGLQAQPEGTFPNSGISVVTWSSIRRPNSPGVSAVDEDAYQPWCVEARFGTNRNSSRTFPTPPKTPGSMNTGDFFDDENGFQEVRRMTSYTPELCSTIVQHPKEKTGNAIGQNRTLRSFASIQVEGTPHNWEYTSIGPDGLFKTGDDESIFRAPHLLAQLAVGPVQDPLSTFTYLGEQPVDAQWMTLSEALAIAMDYDTPAVDDPTWGMYANLGHEQPTGFQPSKARVDRGRLVLDAYEPFLERGAVGSGFDPAVDVRRGLGIPLALNVLELARVIDDGLGTISSPTYGVININTAPLAVLRTIPMLSPMGDVFAPLRPGSSSNWWGQSAPGMHDNHADVAATLLAYRDKIPVQDRIQQVISYADSFATPDNPTDDDGRSLRTSQPAVREALGFRSIAEIMNLIDRSGSLPANAVIDQLGRDSAEIGIPGVEFTLRYSSTGVPDTDSITDDHDEKLAIAGGALGSISVRSDLYCVCFIVHGYQRSDVEGLGPNDPLVPTIARRYVMVVDRSNVVRRGDKPRILLFREVPM